jgi:hypothetical protein
MEFPNLQQHFRLELVISHVSGRRENLVEDREGLPTRPLQVERGAEPRERAQLSRSIPGLSGEIACLSEFLFGLPGNLGSHEASAEERTRIGFMRGIRALLRPAHDVGEHL